MCHGLKGLKDGFKRVNSQMSQMWTEIEGWTEAAACCNLLQIFFTPCLDAPICSNWMHTCNAEILIDNRFSESLEMVGYRYDDWMIRVGR